MKQHRPLVPLLMLSCTMGLIGCSGASGESGASGTPAHTTSATPSISQPASDDEPIQIDRETAFTLQVSDATAAQLQGAAKTLRPKARSGNWVVNPQGITSDEEVLATESSIKALDGAGATLNTFDSVGLWSEENGFVPVAKSGREKGGALAGAERQVTRVAQDGDRLVWVETPSTDLMFMEWSLRTAKMDGSATKELAHSQALKGNARPLPVTGDVYPILIGDWVYWASSVATTPTPDPQAVEDWEFNILRTKVSGKSKVETVARNAVMPAAVGEDLIYASRPKGTSGPYEIHRKAVSGDGADKVLLKGVSSGSSDIVGLFASDSYIAWAVRAPERGEEGWSKKSQPGQIFVMDLAKDEVTTVITADEVATGILELTRTGVLWGNGSGNGDPTEYYLNMPAKKISSLAKNRGNSSVAANPAHDTVMWTQGTNATTHRSLWHLAKLQTPD